MTTQAELRKIAIEAARSYLRRMDIDPVTVEPNALFEALDDLYRTNPKILASVWYGQASDNQIRLFKREFIQWKAERKVG